MRDWWRSTKFWFGYSKTRVHQTSFDDYLVRLIWLTFVPQFVFFFYSIFQYYRFGPFTCASIVHPKLLWKRWGVLSFEIHMCCYSTPRLLVTIWVSRCTKLFFIWVQPILPAFYYRNSGVRQTSFGVDWVHPIWRGSFEQFFTHFLLSFMFYPVMLPFYTFAFCFNYD